VPGSSGSAGGVTTWRGDESTASPGAPPPPGGGGAPPAAGPPIPRRGAAPPAEPLEPGTDVDVTLAYAGTPDTGSFPAGFARVGWQPDDAGGWFSMAEPDGTSTWVPSNDHPSDKATWSFTLDTPTDWTGVANGRLVSRERAGDRIEWRWELDRPIPSYTVVVAVGDYRLEERTGPDGLRIVDAIATGAPAHLDEVAARQDEVIEYFTSRFGPYPFEDAGVLVVDAELSVALETATRPLFDRYGLEWALAHEIAHQWYGDSVTPTTFEHLWLNEGFATYADWLYEDERGTTPLDDDIIFSGGGSGGGGAITDPDEARTFAETIYTGGATALHALRRRVGDDAFFDLLARWADEHRYANADTNDLLALAEEVTGQDLDGWRRDWLDAPDRPDHP